MRFQEHQHRAALNVGVDEMIRQERHHEVLCLVLKVRLAHFQWDISQESECDEVVRQAKLIANLAYPPPKQEMTTREVCDALEEARPKQEQP